MTLLRGFGCSVTKFSMFMEGGGGWAGESVIFLCVTETSEERKDNINYLSAVAQNFQVTGSSFEVGNSRSG